MSEGGRAQSRSRSSKHHFQHPEFKLQIVSPWGCAKGLADKTCSAHCMTNSFTLTVSLPELLRRWHKASPALPGGSLVLAMFGGGFGISQGKAIPAASASTSASLCQSVLAVGKDHSTWWFLKVPPSYHPVD